MIKEVTTYGNVTKGKLSIVDQDEFKASLKALPDCEVEVSIKRIFAKRSNPANRYYRGVCVPIIRKLINEEWGTRLDDDAVHEILKEEHNSEIITTASGRKLKVIKSTADLDIPEFWAYVERCRVWCADFFGVYIPDPVKIASTKTELTL